MEIRIRNQGKQLLLVPLSSRATLHLGPGEVSAAVDDSEISRNVKVSKLANLGLIGVLPVERVEQEPEHAKRKKTKG